MHLGIPPDLWQPWCPFRTLRAWEFPTVQAWLIQFARYRRYRRLPNPGGLDDQDERTLRAFDLMSAVLTLPTVDG